MQLQARFTAEAKKLNLPLKIEAARPGVVRLEVGEAHAHLSEKARVQKIRRTLWQLRHG